MDDPMQTRPSGLMIPKQKPLIELGDFQGHPLDSPKANAIFKRAMGWYIHELDTQAENRLQMAMDDDFYDHIQWSDEELAVLNARGQAPIVFNLTQTTINWVLGSQRRATQDYRILPRKKAGAAAAENKTDLFKHVSDENRSDFEESAAFAQAVKVGIGWMECGAGHPEDGTKVYNRMEDWRAMLWDSTSRRYDLMDARYIFRSKWLDVDVAATLWKERQGVIMQASHQSTQGLLDFDDLGDDAMDSQEVSHFAATSGRSLAGRYGSNRDRVRVVEAWFKMPVPDALVMKGGQFAGELFDEWSPGHWAEINQGVASVAIRPREVTHVAIMTDAGLLDLRPSPYRHNRYPFTPIWGYRRARDNMPYGMIRGIRDIQRDLNKRASKALHHLSTVRTIVQEGAVEDIETLRDEAARPDGVIEYKEGRAAPLIESQANIAAGHVDLMDRDAQMIQSVGGVTDENLGRRTNATSGIAIQRRQDQGALATSVFFENLRQTRQIHGEKQMVLIETYYDQEDEFRITDSRGNVKFKPINDGAPENAIAEFKADFVITDTDWRASARQAQAEGLLELAGKLAATAPQLVVGILDLVVEAMDVPKRDEIVQRLRQLTGTEDPDADPNNPSPETLAAREKAAKEAALAERGMMAQLAEQEAKTRAANANAAKAEASLTDGQIAQIMAAFQAALTIAGAPAVAAAADQVLMNARQEAMDAAQGGQPAPEPAPMPVPQAQVPPDAAQMMPPAPQPQA